MNPDVAPTCDLITQPYGCTQNPNEWNAPDRCPNPPHMFHAGVDVSKSGGSCGEIAHATRYAQVAHVGIPGRPGLGEFAVQLDNADGYSSLYGHLDSALVTVGQHVTPGYAIGHIGTRGMSDGCHLHLEVRLTSANGPNLAGVVDPTPWLNFAPEPPGDDDVQDPHHLTAHLVAAHWDTGLDVVAEQKKAPRDASGHVTAPSPIFDSCGAHVDIVAHRLAALEAGTMTLQDAENDIRSGHHAPTAP